MARSRDNQGKYWYKIEVDTLRLWITLGVVTVLVVGGYLGYSALKDILLSRQIELALEEGRQASEELRTEERVMNFRVEFATGRKSLEEAQELFVSGKLKEARTAAERGRSLLRSILDTLRGDSPIGEAQFIAVQGGVEYRRGERGEWMPARSRVMLYPGDYVKTSSGGSAEVMTVEGTLFTVRPDTVILVDERTSKAGEPDERTIALRTGWVNLNTAQSASRVTTPDAEAVVSRRSEASVSYNEEEKVARFTAYRGDMEITSRDGRTRRLGERQEIEQREERLSGTRSLPDAPVTLMPRDNLEVFISETDRLQLTWQPVRGAATYALQVSRNRLFVDNIIDVDARAKTLATVGLRGEGSFVWRVAANDRQGNRGPWSLPRRFRVSGEPASASLPALRPPAEEDGEPGVGGR